MLSGGWVVLRVSESGGGGGRGRGGGGVVEGW